MGVWYAVFLSVFMMESWLWHYHIISVTKPLDKPFKYHFQKRAGCYYRLVYIQVHNTVIHDVRAENVSDIEEEIAWRFAMETDCSLGYL